MGSGTVVSERFGEIELASAALLDLGVYLVVVGTTLSIIRTVAEE